MKYAFICAHEGAYHVEQMCRLLGVSRSGYYAQLGREESRRERASRELSERIREAFVESGGTYGSVRLVRHFQRAGENLSRSRVARLMKRAHLVPKKARSLRPQQAASRPAPERIAQNLLSREFGATRINQKWVGDITYIQTMEGWLFLAVILDLFSRRVIGWAFGEKIDSLLAQRAFQMALDERRPEKGLLHHTDRGCQYSSASYLQTLQQAGVLVSMSRAGNPIDNAVAESFFSTLKTECADHPFRTRAEARAEIFTYIVGWYNLRRLHSSLGYLSPVEFESLSGHDPCPLN